MSCILLVEDDLVIRKVLSLGISRANADWSVHAAANGHEFLALLHAHTPDLVLLDVTLPDTSGIALYRHIRQHETLQYVPVMFLTALPDRVQRAALTGAYRCLAKPFHLDDVIDEIRAMLPAADDAGPWRNARSWGDLARQAAMPPERVG